MRAAGAWSANRHGPGGPPPGAPAPSSTRRAAAGAAARPRAPARRHPEVSSFSCSSRCLRIASSSKTSGAVTASLRESSSRSAAGGTAGARPTGSSGSSTNGRKSQKCDSGRDGVEGGRSRSRRAAIASSSQYVPMSRSRVRQADSQRGRLPRNTQRSGVKVPVISTNSRRLSPVCGAIRALGDLQQAVDPARRRLELLDAVALPPGPCRPGPRGCGARGPRPPSPILRQRARRPDRTGRAGNRVSEGVDPRGEIVRVEAVHRELGYPGRRGEGGGVEHHEHLADAQAAGLADHPLDRLGGSWSAVAT